MIENKIMKMLFICLAVVLFAPCESMTESNTVDATEMNETTQNDWPNAIDKAELPQSKSVHRHSFKRAVKRFCLAWIRPRNRIRRAVMRILHGDSDNYDEQGMRRIEAQCPSCDEVETIESPFVIRIGNEAIEPQCVDCALCLRDSEQVDEKTEMPRSSPLSVLIVGSFFGALALIEPNMAFGLAIGAVRLPMPKEGKALAKAGFKVRRVAKNRDTNCKNCGVVLQWRSETDRDVQVQMPYSGYAQNKPTCLSCACKMAGNDEPKPETPKPETPKPADPKPANGERPNRFDGICSVCSVSVNAFEGRLGGSNGKEVICMSCIDNPKPAGPKPANEVSNAVSEALNKTSTSNKGEAGSQLAVLIAQLASGAMDEEAVRKIAQSEDRELKTYLEGSLENMSESMTETISRMIQEAQLPTVLHIKTDDGEPIPAGNGLMHHRFKEIMARILKAQAENLNLIGEAGTGKTFLIQQVFDALKAAGFFENKKAECHIQSCNLELQTSDILGRVSPAFFDDGTVKAGDWVFTFGKFLEVFSTHGGVIGLDEMDRLHPSTLSGLNAALANGYIVDPDGKKWVRHPQCVVIATGNTRGMGASPTYSASQKQDGASLDRFACHFMDIDYDSNLEDALCGSVSLSNAIREMRRLAEVHKIHGVVLSYRCMIAARNMIEGGFTEAYTLRSIVEAFGQDAAELLGHGQAISFEDGYNMNATHGGA